jgi:hypothetical protein
LFKGFIRFALAAGKFPQAAEMRLGVTLGDEQFATAENQGGGDINDTG